MIPPTSGTSVESSGWGADVDETAEALRSLVDRMAPSWVGAVGQSMGAYAAILFGTLLEVDRVLAFGPLSYLRSDWARRDSDFRWLRTFEALDHLPPLRRYDDLPTFLAKPRARGAQNSRCLRHGTRSISSTCKPRQSPFASLFRYRRRIDRGNFCGPARGCQMADRCRTHGRDAGRVYFSALSGG